jgi:hypothetical protein
MVKVMRQILPILFLIPSLIFASGLTVSERYIEKNNNRIVLGAGIGIHNVASKLQNLPKETYGLGLQHISGSILHAWQPVTGFEVLSSIDVGGASYGKFLTKSASEAQLSGFNIDSQIGFRYLHFIYDNFDFGGQFFAGYGVNFAEATIHALDALDYAWPLHFRVGPAGRLIFSNGLTWYFALHYTLSGIGKSSSATRNLEKTLIGGVNKHGLELPIGITWILNDNFSLFTEGNFEFRDFSAKSLGFLATLEVGCSIDFIR